MRLFAVGLVAALCGCAANAPPILYGDQRYSPLPPNAAVQVFMKEGEIAAPHKIIGAVSAMDLGKYQVLGIQDAIPVLQNKARSIGANAIVVDDYQPVKSGIISTGYTARATALRLSDQAP